MTSGSVYDVLMRPTPDLEKKHLKIEMGCSLVVAAGLDHESVHFQYPQKHISSEFGIVFLSIEKPDLIISVASTQTLCGI